MTSLTKSKIQKCCVVDKNGKVISNLNQYQHILTDIWTETPTQKILQNTSFNFKLSNENGKKDIIGIPGLKCLFKVKIPIEL